MKTLDELMALADTYADGPHMSGYFGAHRATLESALRELIADAAIEPYREALRNLLDVASADADDLEWIKAWAAARALLEQSHDAAAPSPQPDTVQVPQKVDHGHGHVWPRADGVKARCGGPAMCKLCALDHAAKTLATKESKE